MEGTPVDLRSGECEGAGDGEGRAAGEQPAQQDTIMDETKPEINTESTSQDPTEVTDNTTHNTGENSEDNERVLEGGAGDVGGNLEGGVLVESDPPSCQDLTDSVGVSEGEGVSILASLQHSLPPPTTTTQVEEIQEEIQDQPGETPPQPGETPMEPVVQPGPGETPSEPGETPIEPGDSPTGPGLTPPQPGDSPTGPELTPPQPGETPIEPGETPTQPGETPIEPGETPIEPGETPIEPGDTPTEPGETLIKTEEGAESEPESAAVSASTLNSTHCSKIMFNLINQRQIGKFCDVLIRTSNKQIWAHKCVLSAVSPYFDSFLLKSSTPPDLEGGVGEIQEIEFSEFSTEVVEMMINYMYTGNLCLKFEEADQFILLADKFIMTDTKVECSHILSKMVNLKNWSSCYQIAKKYTLCELATAVSHFITAHIEDIVKDHQFLKLDLQHVRSLVKREDSKRRKSKEKRELSMFKYISYWLSHDFTERKHHLSECLDMIYSDHLNKTRTYRYIETDLADLNNDDVLSDSTLVNWLLALNDDEKKEEEEMIEEEEEEEVVGENEKDDPDYDNDLISDETAPESDDELFIPGKELRHVMPTRRSSRCTTPRRKRKATKLEQTDDEDEVQDEAPPPLVTPPVKRGRGRPRKNDPKPAKPATKTKGRRGRPPGRKNKVKVEPADVEIKEEKVEGEEGEVKEERDEDESLTPRASRVPTVKSKSKCPECSETFTSQSAFRQHMREHGENKPFKCNLCIFQTIHYGIFMSHKRRQHRVDIQCPKCPREFPSQSALNHHMRGHGSDTPFLCDVCGFTTKHFASMNIHKRRHNGKMLKCTFEGCTYESTRTVRLRDHMNMHLGVRNYVCPVCGKAFGSRKHLSRHENIHKSEKDVNCKKLKCPHEGCAYEAVRHTRLRDHMNMHLGLKNYICTVCGKAFGARKHLFRHENIHKTEKILNCEYCTYTTSRRDRIRQHIKRHHPDMAVLLGYINEHEAAVQMQKNTMTTLKAAQAGPGNKKSHKKKKVKEEEEGEKAAESVMNMEVGGVGREIIIPQLPSIPPQAAPHLVTPHIVTPIIHTTEPPPDTTKSDLKQTVTVTHNAASTIVDMIHYFMAPDGATTEQHQTWNYHSNPL